MTRWIVILVLAACGGEGKSPPGGDGGIDASVPIDGTSCAPANGCATGPMCGLTCCTQGHRCVNGACRCGMNMACGVGDSCEAPGPIGGDSCGSICCGATGPCPQ